MLPTVHEEQEIDDDPMAIPFYPFGEALVKNQTRRRSTSDYVYGALFYIVMLALAFAVIYNDVYLYQPKMTNHANCTNHATSTIHAKSTNLKIDEISSAPLGWIPQTLASVIIGQTIAWATLYFSCGTLHRFPSLTLTLDVATLVISLPFHHRVCSDTGGDWGILVMAIGPVVASFILLPTIRRFVARVRATLADLARVLGLGIWRSIVAYGARYWARSRRRIALGQVHDRGPEVERENISCAQAHDTAETFEEFDAYQTRRHRRLVIRFLAWTTFLRLTFLSWFFADRIINLLNYDGFLDHYVLAVTLLVGLSMMACSLRYAARGDDEHRVQQVEVPIGIF